MILKEYVTRISDDDLKFLNSRISQKLSGDVPEALNLMAQSPDIDKLMRDQPNGEALYETLDALQQFLERESLRRER